MCLDGPLNSVIIIDDYCWTFVLAVAHDTFLLLLLLLLFHAYNVIQRCILFMTCYKKYAMLTFVGMSNYGPVTELSRN